MTDFDTFDWDDDFDEDVKEFVTLLPGKYVGTITNVEKKRWDAQGKLNGCPYAEVTVKFETDEGVTTVSDNIFLKKDEKFSWRIAQFLTACKLKKKSEAIKVSKMLDAVEAKVLCTIQCQADKDDNYKNLTDEDEIKRKLEREEPVYNKIKSYAAVDDDLSDDDFGWE